MPGASATEQLTAALQDVRVAIEQYLKHAPATDSAQPPGDPTQRAILQKIIDSFKRPTETTTAEDAATPTTRTPVETELEARPRPAPPGLPAPVRVYERQQATTGTVTRAAARAAARHATEGGTALPAAIDKLWVRLFRNILGGRQNQEFALFA